MSVSNWRGGSTPSLPAKTKMTVQLEAAVQYLIDKLDDIAQRELTDTALADAIRYALMEADNDIDNVVVDFADPPLNSTQRTVRRTQDNVKFGPEWMRESARRYAAGFGRKK